MRVLIAVLASVAANTVFANPTACPASHDALIADITTVGQNKRMGELCRVEQPRIQRMVEKHLESFKPCMQGLGVSEADIKAAMAKGATQGEGVFNRSGVKEQLCMATSEGIGN